MWKSKVFSNDKGAAMLTTGKGKKKKKKKEFCESLIDVGIL